MKGIYNSNLFDINNTPCFEILETEQDASNIGCFITKLDNNLTPDLSGEDLRCLSDYPLIYIYIGFGNGENNKVFYIGQTIDIQRRIEEHKEKLNKDDYEKFKKFKNGLLLLFYNDEISCNLNFIENTLIAYFVKQFNFFNFVDLDTYDKKSEEKDGTISKELANRDHGIDSCKNQNLREYIDKTIIKPIVNFLHEIKILDKKNTQVDKNYFTLFKETPFFSLTKNQEKILYDIKNKLNNKSNITCIHSIKGDAGTGKTILLLHLIGQYLNEFQNSKIGVVLSTTQKKRYTRILSAYGIDCKALDIDIGTSTTIGKNIHDKGKRYDLLIVDEAQRTTKEYYKDNKRLRLTSTKSISDFLDIVNEKSVLSYLYKYANNLVLAYDIEQNLRVVDNVEFDDDLNLDDDKRTIFKETENKKVDFKKYVLKAQLRLKTGNIQFANDYIGFIKNILGLGDKKISNSFVSKNLTYQYIKIANSEEEWISYILDKQNKFPQKKSVLVSGYCKPKPNKKNEASVFLELKSSSQEQKDRNEKVYWCNDRNKFLKYDDSNLLVGLAYDIQGYDVDFSGVYIGKDIYLDKDRIVKTAKVNFYDRDAKKGVEDKIIDKLIRKSYYVLLTRAIHGQIWYIEDIPLREEIKRKLEL